MTHSQPTLSIASRSKVFYIASATCAEPAVMMVREAARLTRGLSVQMVWVQAEEEIAQVRQRRRRSLLRAR